MSRPLRTAGFNTKSPTIKRILQESRELSLSPDPFLQAAPLETNLFEWHFTIAGPPSTPYADGIYHGRIVLPSTYPLRPPSFRFLTPSGRFETNREICLSISGHHEESWQPAWGIRTALCAIRAFMAGEAKGQVGGLDMQEDARRRLAKESRMWKCAGCGGKSNEEILKEVEGACEGSAEKRKEEIIPEQLRLGYREDLGKKEETKEQSSAIENTRSDTSKMEIETTRRDDSSTNLSSATTLNLATTSVSTTTLTNNVLPPSRPLPSRSIPAASPSRTATAPSSLQVRQRAQTSRGDALSTWLDKAILGLAISLAVMILKKILL
ncbi:hypothetical protein MMC25_004876 [Agyrium rufum]|nr:hypothetical protein [Agyrium rufum]